MAEKEEEKIPSGAKCVICGYSGEALEVVKGKILCRNCIVEQLDEEERLKENDRNLNGVWIRGEELLSPANS